MGEEYTVSGQVCEAILPAGAYEVGGYPGPEMSFVHMEISFEQSGEASSPGEHSDPVVNDTEWSLTGTATQAGSYTVVQVCHYEAYDGWMVHEKVTSSGALVVTGDSSAGGGEGAGVPGTPALPAEPGAGSSRGSVTLSKIITENGVTYVTLQAGNPYAGQTVFGTIFSTPHSLGSAVVSATGEVTFALPSTVARGEHKIVLQRADGTVIGFAEITLDANGWKATSKEGLAETGGASMVGIGVLGASALAVGAGLLLVRRKRSIVE